MLLGRLIFLWVSADICWFNSMFRRKINRLQSLQLQERKHTIVWRSVALWDMFRVNRSSAILTSLFIYYPLILTSQSYGKSTLNTQWKDCWSSSILAIWREQPTQWKSPQYWERLRAGGEEGTRGPDGWMVLPMRWTWTWANSRR